jgi:hypothetical protein
MPATERHAAGPLPSLSGEVNMKTKAWLRNFALALVAAALLGALHGAPRLADAADDPCPGGFLLAGMAAIWRSPARRAPSGPARTGIGLFKRKCGYL